jgi:hypothetical protein
MQLPLLARVELPRGQPGVGEKPPEVVSGVGEVVPGRRGAPARVDPAEDDEPPPLLKTMNRLHVTEGSTVGVRQKAL